MKQRKICKWLKLLVIFLGIMGLIFFGCLTNFAIQMKVHDTGSSIWSFIFFSWYTAGLCYAVLFQFWKVCDQIGNDNSFSLENAVSFHRMGLLGVASAIGYMLRLLYLFFIQSLNIWSAIYCIFLILLSIAFFIICEALSQLIRNAYEVKQENELTI